MILSSNFQILSGCAGGSTAKTTLQSEFGVGSTWGTGGTNGGCKGDTRSGVEKEADQHCFRPSQWIVLNNNQDKKGCAATNDLHDAEEV